MIGAVELEAAAVSAQDFDICAVGTVKSAIVIWSNQIWGFGCWLDAAPASEGRVMYLTMRQHGHLGLPALNSS